MRVGPGMVIIGALIGSLVVAAFGILVTAHAAPDLASSSLNPIAAAENPAPANGEQNPPAETGGQESGSTGAEASESSSEESECEVSDAFPESIRQWCGIITQFAHERDLPPDLVAAVMLQESGGQHLAYSRSGAVGLLQVMPRDGIAASFVCVNGPCFSSRPTIEELQDPEFNIEYGTRMLANLVGRYGNFRDALFAYGPMDVGYSYADKVLSIYENYGD